jgi:hypothetical protein
MVFRGFLSDIATLFTLYSFIRLCSYFTIVICFVFAELAYQPNVPALFWFFIGAFWPMAIFFTGFARFLVNGFKTLKTVTKATTYSGICPPPSPCNIFLKWEALFFSATTSSSMT